MASINRTVVSAAVAQLMPQVIQGVQLDFLSNRAITQTQFFVLVAIHSYGRCPMTVLSRNMKVSMPTISGIVDRLVKGDFIRRVDDPNDRRQVVVELTAKGKQLILQFQSSVSLRWQDVLKSLNDEELKNFYQVVTKLKNSLMSGKKDEK